MDTKDLWEIPTNFGKEHETQIQFQQCERVLEKTQEVWRNNLPCFNIFRNAFLAALPERLKEK